MEAFCPSDANSGRFEDNFSGVGFSIKEPLGSEGGGIFLIAFSHYVIKLQQGASNAVVAGFPEVWVGTTFYDDCKEC